MSAYIKILRLPNLLIIILTQGLLRFCVIEPFFSLGAVKPAMDYVDFGILLLSTIMIAAGGYVINDYYDAGIDRINKPNKLIAGNFISFKPLKIYYAVLTISGIATGFWLSLRVHYLLAGFIFPVVAIMLWYYSSKYQKTILAGNLMIAIMSGLVVLIVWIFEMFALLDEPVKYVDVMSLIKPVGLIVVAYTVFAFLVTLMREVLKDTEDVKGDEAFGYKTLPVVYGLQAAKQTSFATGIIVICLLGLFQYYLYDRGFNLVFWYLMIAVQTLLCYQVFFIKQATSKGDFHFLSNVSKIIMLAGILSMQLFYISL